MRVGVSLVAVGLLLLLATAKAPAATITLSGSSSITLAELLDGDDVIVGDKWFYDFGHWVSAATNTAPVSPADITVSGIPGPEIGLFFSSPTANVLAGQTKDFHFDFNVLVLHPSWLITDNTLKFTASASSQDGSAFAGIAENVFADATETVKLADKLVWTNGTSQFVDHVVYTTPDRDVHVNKDIALVGGTGAALISDFTQTFSQTPLPAGAWMGLSLLGTMIVFKAARRKE